MMEIYLPEIHLPIIKSLTQQIILKIEGELENSIARLKNMNIKTIYPGHGKPFEMEQIAGKL